MFLEPNRRDTLQYDAGQENRQSDLRDSRNCRCHCIRLVWWNIVSSQVAYYRRPIRSAVWDRTEFTVMMLLCDVDLFNSDSVQWDDKAPSNREIFVGKILGWAFAAPSGVFLMRWLFAILRRDVGTFGSSWSFCLALLAFIVGEFMICHPRENYRHLKEKPVRTASVDRCTGRTPQPASRKPNAEDPGT